MPWRSLAEVTAAEAVNEPAHDVGDGRLVTTAPTPDGNGHGCFRADNRDSFDARFAMAGEPCKKTRSGPQLSTAKE